MGDVQISVRSSDGSLNHSPQQTSVACGNVGFKPLSAGERLLRALLAALCIQQQIVSYGICINHPTLFKQASSTVRAAEHQWRLGMLAFISSLLLRPFLAASGRCCGSPPPCSHSSCQPANQSAFSNQPAPEHLDWHQWRVGMRVLDSSSLITAPLAASGMDAAPC